MIGKRIHAVITVIYVALAAYSQYTYSQELPVLSPYPIQEIYEYDPVNTRFVKRQVVVEQTSGYPMYLSVTAFYEAVRRQTIASNYRDKTDALSKVNDSLNASKKDLLPTYYVNSDFFESVFGGNTITVATSGGFNFDTGALVQRTENPGLALRNQRSTLLDIDQQFDFNLDAQIGERLTVSAAIDSRSAFSFENLFKLTYTPQEDDWLRSIEFGNVSLPIQSTLMSGAQNVFGVKTEFQFGRTRLAAIYGEQRAQRTSVRSENGNVVNRFELSAIDYEENTHFFLAHYFRDQYDVALENYPFIASNVQITRMEVWVTNRQQQTDNVRSIVAFQDLGESLPENVSFEAPESFYAWTSTLPDNRVNALDPALIGGTGVTAAIRAPRSNLAELDLLGQRLTNGVHFTNLNNARKLEAGVHYSFNAQLGYLSLNQPLSTDEVLAVAFQYTYNGQVYTVGEFSNDNRLGSEESLVVKLLKSTITRVEDPIWDLMMKNIYAIGAFGLTAADFQLQLLYKDPSPRNFLSPADENLPWPDSFKDQSLLRIFNFDRLDAYDNVSAEGDGFFDFVDGVTVDAENGRIIFTKTEPFGSFLFSALRSSSEEIYEDLATYNANQQKFVYQSLYGLTKAAALQDASANRFAIKGSYAGAQLNDQSSIPLGVLYAVPGSVQVRAGGRLLTEGIDYEVDYTTSSVILLDPSIAASGVPIDVTAEDAGQLGQLTRRFFGLTVDHEFSDNFQVGGALMNLRERPLTQKAAYGVEPINNTMIGATLKYRKEVPFLTRLINQWPTIDTEVPSEIAIQAEVAALIPSAPANTSFNQEITSYIDDFEDTQQFIDLTDPKEWVLSSHPDGLTGVEAMRDRARLAWYTIDPLFYGRSRPAGITEAMLGDNRMRRVFINEVYPETDVIQGQTAVQRTLDVAYFPNEAGPYNTALDFNPNATSARWGGTMRAFSNTNFEQSNIEYLQFWMMHPVEPGSNVSGKLVIDLGNVSEDILPDQAAQFENGLDAQATTVPFGRVPLRNALIYNFDNDPALRASQDLGLDGIDDAQEALIYPGPSEDPARDNYQNYLETDGSIVDRYKFFNNTQGNSPIEASDFNRGSSVLPDVEDADRDFATNTVESYFQYEIPLQAVVNEDSPYVATVRTIDNPSKTVWVQYKIPLREFTKAVGGIQDFRSIPFMRMVLKDFDTPVVLRFAGIDLVQGSWRIYDKPLEADAPPPSGATAQLEIGAINIEENSNRSPIPYVLPPGVVRERLNNTNTIVRENEQSLRVYIENLKPQEAKAVFRRVQFDMRRHDRLKLFVHAESPENNLQEEVINAFIRMGTDYSENFYEIEWPIRFTPHGAVDPEQIWPDNNALDLDLKDLSRAKSLQLSSGSLDHTVEFEGYTVRVKGNPSIGSISSAMLGVKNMRSPTAVNAELWFNEFRLSGINHRGGWAMNASAQLSLSDVVRVGSGYSKSTVGFGAIDDNPNLRGLDNTQSFDLNLQSNLGRFLPQGLRLRAPFSFSWVDARSTPEYDPVYEDLTLVDRMNAASTSQDAAAIKEQAEQRNEIKSFALQGLSIERKPDSKEDFFDLENFSASVTSSKTFQSDFETAFSERSSANANLSYAFAGSVVGASLQTAINRLYSQQQYRQLYDPSVEFIAPPMLLQQNFRTNWQGSLSANPLEGLSVVLNATQNNIVPVPSEETNSTATVWSSFLDWGQPNTYNQTIRASYTLPFNAISWTDFLSAQLDYTGSFNAQRGSDALLQLAGEPVNTIQTASTINASGALNVSGFFEKIGLKWEGFSVNVRSNWTQNEGLALPGYNRIVNDRGFFELDPMLTFGRPSSDLRFEAAQRGYLTQFGQFNSPFIFDANTTVNTDATINFGSKVSLNLNYQQRQSDRIQEQFRVINGSQGLSFESLLANEQGSYSTTAVLLSSIFKATSSSSESAVFEDFKTLRLAAARRLAVANGLDNGKVDAEGFPAAYSSLHPEVLLTALVAAYSGKDINATSLSPFHRFGLPNWTLSVNQILPEVFSRFTLNHGYRSAYSVNQYQNNLAKNDGLFNPENLDVKPDYIIGSVVLNDQFNPLIGVDFETKRLWQFQSSILLDRMLNFSFSNNLLTEIRGQEFVLGMGKRFSQLKWSMMLGGTRQYFTGDLVLKGDVSYRTNETILRALDEALAPQVTAGQERFSGRLTADYAFTNQLNIMAYYDHTFSRFKVSTAFPQMTLRAGLSLRYRFGN